MASFGSCKGVSINTSIEVLREELGSERFEACIAGMHPEAQRLARRRVLAVEWVPLSAWHPFLDRVFDFVHGSNVDSFKAFCRRVCERDFNSFYRMMIKLGSPGSIVNKGSAVFNKYHEGAGSYGPIGRYVKDEREYTVSRLQGFPPWPLERHIIGAFIEQLLVMSSARDVRVVEIKFELGETLAAEWESSWSV